MPNLLRYLCPCVLVYVGEDTLLNRDGLAALAESLTNKSIAAQKTSLPTTVTSTEQATDLHNIYPLAFHEAEQQAGWDGI